MHTKVCTIFEGSAKTAFKRCIIKWFFTRRVREDIPLVGVLFRKPGSWEAGKIGKKEFD